MSFLRVVEPVWVVVMLSGMLLLEGSRAAAVQEASTETLLTLLDPLAELDQLAPAGVDPAAPADNALDSTTPATILYSMFLETTGDNTTSVKKSDPRAEMDQGDSPAGDPSSAERYAIVEEDIMVETELQVTEQTDAPTATETPTAEGIESTIPTETAFMTEVGTTDSETTLTPPTTQPPTEGQKDSDSSEEESNEVSEKKCKHCSHHEKHQGTQDHQHKHKKGGHHLTKMIQECIRDSISEHEARKEMWTQEIVKDVVNGCIQKFR